MSKAVRPVQAAQCLVQVLSALKRLKLLDIRGTQVEGIAAAAIASLQDLEMLNTRRACAQPLQRRLHMTGRGCTIGG